jgi:hypothetical protein
MNALVEPDLDLQAKAYARGELTSYLLNDGYKPTGFHVYTDATGLPIYWKVRLRHDSKGKTLRAFARNDGRIHSKTNQPYQGQFMPCEPSNAWQAAYPQGNGKKPLYRLHELSSNPLHLVFIVEGEQKADALAKLGLIATTSGSTGSVNTTDWQLLAGRTVRLWRDNDDAGVKYQDEVKAVLVSLGCDVSIVDVDALGLPVKGDVVDWLAMRDGVNTTADDVLGLSLIQCGEQNACARDEGKEGYFKASDAVNSEVEQVAEPEPDLEDDLKRLASLSLIDYERCRNDEAKRLKVRPLVLDKLIKPYKVDEETEASGTDLFTTVEPWDDEVDGMVLLDEIASIIHRHIVCEKPTIHAATLWIAFSWCIDVMQVSPIACVTAPEKRCGKTQLLNLIGMLCMKPLPASNITAAALFRSIEAFEPTLLIDEADAFLGQNEELRGIINSGHTRQSAFVIRTVGDNHEPKRFSTWGAKAISGIGHLSDTLKDRSILLELRRKQPNENRDRLRHADTSQFEQVKRKLARWAGDNMEALRIARPALPEALNDRAQDNWESLLAIADRVGGHWGKTARHAAMAISGIEDEAPSINEELLADIKQAFEKMRVSRISSVDLLEHLCGDEEAPWATWAKGRPMTPRQLSKRLSDFGITSKTMRDGSGTFKGYELSDFKDAFNRYLKVIPAHTSNESVTRSQPNDSKAFSQNESVTSHANVTDRKPLEPLQTQGCYRVTDRMPTQSHDGINQQSAIDNQGNLFI